MGKSHALACERLSEFEVCGVVTRTAAGRADLMSCLEGSGEAVSGFDDFEEALSVTQPDAVIISTYPDTHASFALMALEAGADVFLEKPLAETVAEAEAVVRRAEELGRKVMVGYILRHHPSWIEFIKMAQTLGKPLVMRMNLNQQSKGREWETHKALMSSISPVVDCGVHYVDVMCQMTRAKPLRVSGIGARLSEELPEGKINYGHLQVSFDDGSVGWYEAGWGPMMSETAFFVKDVVGPAGSVSIAASEAGGEGASSTVDAHTRTEALRVHHAILQEGEFLKQDDWISMKDEPSHEELCMREQQSFARAIRENLDLREHLADAVNSLRIVLAADESFRTGQTVDLEKFK